MPKKTENNIDNERLPDGSTPLHNEVRAGNVKAIKLLITQGADITALDADRKKPIDYTSNPEIIEILTQANEDLNCKVQHFFDKYKKFTDITIIERTLSNENLPKHITDKVVEKIIDNWSEQLFKKYKDTDIEILPFVLFEENITDSSIIEKLTQKIKNYNENGDNPVTTPVVDAPVLAPITTATTTTTTTVAAEDDVRTPIPEIVDTIVIHPEDNRKPLGIAAETGNADIVKELIEQGANVNEQDEYGNTALFYATTQEIAKILVDKGADFKDIKNKDGNKPIHFAAGTGNEELLIFLLENDVNVHTRNDNGHTALHCAAYTKQLEIAKILLQYDSVIDPLDNLGATPFLYFIRHYTAGEDKDFINFFVDNNANPNIEANGESIRNYVLLSKDKWLIDRLHNYSEEVAQGAVDHNPVVTPTVAPVSSTSISEEKLSADIKVRLYNGESKEDLINFVFLYQGISDRARDNLVNEICEYSFGTELAGNIAKDIHF